jgi:hypothetical protein
MAYKTTYVPRAEGFTTAHGDLSSFGQASGV